MNKQEFLEKREALKNRKGNTEGYCGKCGCGMLGMREKIPEQLEKRFSRLCDNCIVSYQPVDPDAEMKERIRTALNNRTVGNYQ